MNATPRRLTRSRTQHMLGGVCGGLADYFNVDVTLVRLAFVFVSILPGPSIIFYILAWILIPLEPATPTKHPAIEAPHS